MNIKPRATHYIICPLILIILAAGCSRYFGQPPDTADPAAQAELKTLLSTLKNKNRHLKNFKGIGHIKARQEGQIKLDERIAWIGSETAKLNIAILVSGHPAVKLASDGKWFYYYEAREGNPLFKKIPATDANLKRIISMPINTSDVIHLLAGRIPLREHHAASLEPQDSGDGYVLVLKQRWWGVIEKVYFDETKDRVLKAEFYDRAGSLIYRASFDETQTIKGYQVPARLRLANNEGVDIDLVVNKYWADVTVSPSMFVLNPPP